VYVAAIQILVTLHFHKKLKDARKQMLQGEKNSENKKEVRKNGNFVKITIQLSRLYNHNNVSLIRRRE